ncbi:hypothetical protein T11_15872 [Trichinella zimbabwensis]|uniref:Uncharacterized protein n=1 Tax=Trichinella zimbabwensis TaxID=268475 RepID=A0A0V1H3V0_9BILA|nr:hypothetical protein T11_15872 [Trichinella zimbabwensis]
MQRTIGEIGHFIGVTLSSAFRLRLGLNDKPQLQEEKSRKNGDNRHISELQQRLADCTSLDFDLHKGCICLRSNSTTSSVVNVVRTSKSAKVLIKQN